LGYIDEKQKVGKWSLRKEVKKKKSLILGSFELSDETPRNVRRLFSCLLYDLTKHQEMYTYCFHVYYMIYVFIYVSFVMYQE